MARRSGTGPTPRQHRRPVTSGNRGCAPASNVDLEAIGISFYELLSSTECFITDYSSLWVDFVLRDRPMIAFCPDLDNYRADRGLALEPHEEWFPGPVARSRVALLRALDEALLDPSPSADEHSASRAWTRKLLHTATSDPVAATWEHVEQVVRR